MRKILYPIFYSVVVLCVLSVLQVNAQTAEKILIKGRIIDSKDKLPVIGATVVEQDADKRTITGVATDIDGNFAIKISDVTHKVVISTIGYKTKILDIGTRRVFNTTLESNSNALS